MQNESGHLTDKAVVTDILNGNVQAFAVVVKSTEKLVMQIVNKMTSNVDDRKDLVQEIYLKAYRNLASFQFKSKLSTWIANIAYNTTVNFLQKKKIPVTGIEGAIEEISHLNEHPEQETIKAEAVEILHEAIGKLPPLYKTLITLYHLEELSNQEIAVITELPEGTIKSYLYRARKILKDSIEQQYKNQ
ncbi:RNA polymerase sigma-70 factor (ECF subfamily) [Lacibacter cauensis]|uniref:RNA polymerase sigma-70 factor (ECF subfamily) n=1 Tax=Lacibacter cauensis TaxID=510947 RepID=A0A562SX85_9BACT|nr:sigma-70 family RNA polymerase sigma factor [Lacibacter cauensis]TWI85773.1 RNA polymerase sigma-70 factor (ECF subfamily) [Lacibacter cauensis]